MLSSLASVALRWLGQACFLITVHGITILIDPPDPSVGYPVAAHSIRANAVFVSHEHPDHNWTMAAAGTPVVIQPFLTPHKNATTTLATLGTDSASATYTRIFAYHDNVHGAQRGPDTITVIKVDGLRICHLGDLGELQLTSKQIKSIGPIDVLMIPVGGYFTIDASQAAEIVTEIKPRVVIPRHYQTPALNAKLQSLLHPVTEFETAMQSQADIVNISSRDLKLDPKHLPKRETVYVLRYQ